MTTTIQKSSIVRLIVGSPLMIVEALSSEVAICRWFNGASLSKAEFPLSVLRLATDEELKP